MMQLAVVLGDSGVHIYQGNITLTLSYARQSIRQQIYNTKVGQCDKKRLTLENQTAYR